MPLRSSTAAAGDSDADILLPDATVHSASSDTDSDRVQTLVQGLTEQLRQARDQAQAHLGELKVQSSYYQEQLATANHDMGFFRASASEKEKQARQLQNRCLTLESQNEHLDLENADLRRNCNSLKQQQQQTSQELADTQQKHDYEIARNQELQEQVHMLTRCLDEEAVRKSGDCTVLIAFDNQQRQQQYRHAVRTFLQPIEDKFVLDVDVVQKPKACKFLLYVTYSSTVRLVNFDTAAFEDFKQGCPTGEQLLRPCFVGTCSLQGCLLLVSFCVLSVCSIFHL